MTGGRALIVIDVQQGFADPAWGPRNNPDCEAHIRALISQWRSQALPIVVVRHDSTTPGSPLRPDQSGNDLLPDICGDALVTKHVNSAFYGAPDLDAWLRERDITAVAICGITTNHCCETTARMAGNLGYDTWFILDATHTFDRTAPDGTVIAAADVARMTAANLHGEFATVMSTAEALSRTLET